LLGRPVTSSRSDDLTSAYDLILLYNQMNGMVFAFLVVGLNPTTIFKVNDLPKVNWKAFRKTCDLISLR
ncbi:MAG: hypothetical protein LBE38_10570, partial [Deltaproteobacteria bacterium]|nr:hypothetical protein [Deltaproteobacteria bacterium]